jgi:PAS domain S-box-containing protein
VVLLPILLLALVLGGATHRLAAGYERERAHARFDEYLAERAFFLEKELLAHTEVLESLRSFFENSVEVTREEFASFAEPALERYPAVRALEWIPRIRERERSGHERRARAQGLEGYQIREKNLAGELVPARPRAEYYPVTYLEPLAGNEPALGFDLGSERARKAAIERAMQSGGLTLSEPLALVQDEEAATGFLALLAVRGEQARERRCQGFALLVFRIDDVLARAFPPREQERGRRLHYRLTSGEARPALVASNSNRCGSCPPDREASERPIELGGQSWRLHGHPTEAFFAEHRSSLPFSLGVVVLLICLTLGGSSLLYLRNVRDAEARKQDRMFRAVCHNLAEGVCIADAKGKLVFCNDSAERILGLRPSELEVDDWSKVIGLYRPDTTTLYPAQELPLARALHGEVLSGEELFIRNAERPDGLWVSVNASPLVNGSGEVQGGVAIFGDVSKRRAAEESLQRLSSAVEQTADAVFITNGNGIIQYVNPAFVAITGYTREEAIGKTPRILKSGIHDEDYYRSLWTTILQGEVHRATTINRKKNGEMYFSEQTIAPMRDPSGGLGHFVAVCKDMTESRLRQEHELELSLAAQVQERLYPDRAPTLRGLDLAGAVSSAKLTCGDYLDYLPVSASELAIVVGDVSGHGLGPALIMAQTRAYVHSLTDSGLRLADILRRLNSFLAADLEDDRFVTLMLLQIDVAARRLSYASAGHPEGFVISARGDVKELLEPTGVALGFLPDSDYVNARDIELEEGDILAVFTDGLVETRSPDGELFTVERAIEVVRESRAASAREIVERLQEAVRAFRSGMHQEDDITMAICRLGERSPTGGNGRA